MLDINSIGARIKQARLRACVSQAALAEMSGVSRTTIIGIERGTIVEIGFRRLEKIIKVAESLSVNATYTHTKDGQRKSEMLELSFPYDWSNPDLPDEILIKKVVEQGIFSDIAKVCIRYGFPTVQAIADKFIEQNPFAGNSLTRMMKNIQIGLS